MSRVPTIRISACNPNPPNSAGHYILYWMTAFRRTSWNFALDRAIEWARDLKKPLLILEALRCDYPWASDRLHRFVLDGMAEKALALSGAGEGIRYFPYVEPRVHGGRGLLRALGADACVVVTDDYPGFFLPSMKRSAARQLSCCLEAVDSNGLLPLRAPGRVFPTAFSFRRFLQEHLPPYLAETPDQDPLARLDLPRFKALPKEIAAKWPLSTAADLGGSKLLAKLPIRHDVGSVNTRGGEAPAQAALRTFFSSRLEKYLDLRNEPEEKTTSELSPYLHFGHVSSHQIFHQLAKRENWSEEKLALRTSGSREGWWGVQPSAEAFLDQLVTWRELGFNFSFHHGDDSRFDSLPDWSRATLLKHARDERERLYSLEQFAGARTHDPLWNAAQHQLLQEGRIHNYMRMLWGKKILEWTCSPQESLEVMIELNNRYALDGRDPNSYSGIFWCLGRYDRPWGPERPIFGTVRYMSSKNAARKLHLKGYLEKYGSGSRLYRKIEN